MQLTIYLMVGIKDIQNNETHTLWPMHSLSTSLTISKIVKQGILTKNQSPLPIYSSTYLLVSLLFHFIFVMNYVMTMTNKFQMPSPNSSLVITFKPKATKDVCTGTKLWFYTIQKYYINKSCTFAKYIIICHFRA